jgi:DNA polymerase-4
VAPKIRKIIHIDMDCFYAAVEIRDNPTLKGKPVAVGGSAEGRGVLTTASYEARKFGLRSAMPTSTALKLCPQLILIPVHFDKYRAESKKVRNILDRYTDKIEPLSLDEAYIDVTDSPHCEGIATKIAAEIRKTIFDETKLTASAGIAPNKFLAKVASDWKKPNGQFTVTPQMVPDFVKTLKVEKIPGVGKVTAKKMHELGLFTCADLQALSMDQLHHHFGSWGLKLYDISRGQDDREVSDDGERKSVSVENTFSKDLISVDECVDKIPEIFEDLTRRLDRAQVKDQIKSLFVKIKFADFKQTTLESRHLKNPTVENYALMVAEAFDRRNKPVRLIGIGVRLVSEKTKPASPQLSLLDI